MLLYQVGTEPGEGESCPVRMAVSVPKRLFRRAVDRNLLKRRIREAYRKNKTGLYDAVDRRGGSLRLMIQYRHTEILDYERVESAVISGLSKIAEVLSE